MAGGRKGTGEVVILEGTSRERRLKQKSTVHDIELFLIPLNQGWIYPCTLDDIDAVLSNLDKVDLVGLTKIGLAPSTRKDNSANARYFYRPSGSEILIYSYAASLNYSYRTRLKLPQLRRSFLQELKYGMNLELLDGKVRFTWSEENLRAFISRHVLLHEIGHHVYQSERVRRGFKEDMFSATSEKAAELYALRMSSKIFDIGLGADTDLPQNARERED